MDASLEIFSAQLRQVLQEMSPHIERLRQEFPLDEPDMSISDVSCFAVHHVDTLAVIPSTLLRSRDAVSKVRASGREAEFSDIKLYNDPQLVERVALQTLQYFKVKMAVLPDEVPKSAINGQLLPELAALLPIADKAIELCEKYIAEYPKIKTSEIGGRGI